MEDYASLGNGGQASNPWDDAADKSAPSPALIFLESNEPSIFLKSKVPPSSPEPLCGVHGLPKRFGVYLTLSVFNVVLVESQFPHKSDNLFSILVIVTDKLTDLWWSCLLKKDFKNTLREISPSGWF